MQTALAPRGDARTFLTPSPAQGARHDPAAEGGRDHAARPRRDHHRDGGQAAPLRGAAPGLAQPGDIRRPPPERLTARLCGRPAAGRACAASHPPLTTWSRPWPTVTPHRAAPPTARVSESHRRTKGGRIVSTMRRAPARGRVCLVRRVRRETPGIGARPVCRSESPGRALWREGPQRQTQGRRTASAKRRRARVEAGTCTRCGRRPPVEGGTVCDRCREARRAAERERYRRLRERGLCVTCGEPAFDGQSRCGVCTTVEGERRDSAGKNDAARQRYDERRARNACTDCGQPAYGACRCPECADRSYERADHFRGIPILEPTFAVIELDTGTVHGPFDSEAAASLVFAKLSLHEVEIVSDAPITATVTGWS